MKHLLLLTTLFALTVAQTVVPNGIYVQGNKFYNATTNQQYVFVGVDYQPSSDPFGSLSDLNRDIPVMKSANITSIRVYQTNLNTDPTAALNLLYQNGIYVVIDVTDKDFTIVATKPEWNLDIFNKIKQKISPFIKHPATLAVLAGNEVINAANQTQNAAFIKAAVTDIKAFIKSQGRSTLVGYAGTDIPRINANSGAYFSCLSRDQSVDFYGLNSYRACDDSASATLTSNGFDGTNSIKTDFTNFNLPIILTEYGCNTLRVQNQTKRGFKVVEQLYSAPVISYISGGFAYEWVDGVIANNNYGLFNISNGALANNDFDVLKTQLNAAVAGLPAILGSNPGGATTPNTVSSCPTYSNTDICNQVAADDRTCWLSKSNLPPSSNNTFCECYVNTLSCVIKNQALVQNVYEFACNQSPDTCTSVATTPISNTYGAYSGCTNVQRASVVANNYYVANNNNAQACDFTGAAGLVTPSNSCAAVPDNTVTSTVTRNTNAQTGTGTGTGTGNNNGGGGGGGSGDASSLVPAIFTLVALVGMMAM